MMFDRPYELVSPLLPDAGSLLPDIREALSSKWLTNDGPFVRRLERRMAEVLGVPHAIAVSSGTLGLMVAIRALGWAGEVITPSFSFAGVAHAIVWAGCVPVLAEVDEATFTLDPASVGRLVGSRTSGVIPVDAYGLPCDLDALRTAAPAVPILVDSAHALGSAAPSLRVPAARVVSLSPTKTVVAGEGGLVCTADADLAARMRRARNFGFERGYDATTVGLNARLPELAAILAYHQIEAVPRTIAGRRAWDEAYREALASVPGIRFQAIPEGFRTNHQYMPILIDREAFGRSRDEVAGALRARNIVTRPYFSPPNHRMACYAGELRCDDLRRTERLSDEVLCLPVHPGEPPEIAARIAEVVRSLRR